MSPQVHKTPRPDTPAAPLPDGVTRCSYTTPDATLATCHALLLTLQPMNGADAFDLVVWRDRPAEVKPVDKPRVTALRPGDWVRWRGGVYAVGRVEVWR